MSKKPRKVGEAAADYAAKNVPNKPAAPEPERTSDDAAFKKVVDKIFAERKELLHKLAQ